MTRINLVPPRELHHKHLVAEYRELPRTFALAQSAYARTGPELVSTIPPEFTLGTGHVRFFYNKLIFLSKRQHSLVKEMQRRGYKPSHTEPYSLNQFDHVLKNDYIPTPEAIRISRGRLILKNPQHYTELLFN